VSENTVLTIRSRSDVERLNPYRRGEPSLGFRQIRLAAPAMPQAEVNAREDRLNRLFFSCGCAEATVFGLVALGGVVAWMTLRPQGWAGLAWSDLAYTIAAFFLAAGAGKGIGRLRARHALRREIAQLIPHLAHDKRDEQLHRAPCGVK
jgi:hypothetical protein